MANSLNVRLINMVTDIAQGDNASTVILELLDENKLVIPTLNGKQALINFINRKGEIAYQYETFVFDSRVEFNVDTVIEHGVYSIEVRVNFEGFNYVFPSKTAYTLRINKSANDFYNIAVNMNGLDVVVTEVYKLLENENPGLLEHVSRRDNPHSVTKEQVGLKNVPNYDVATNDEAEKGEIDNKFMTPLKTKDAISSLESVKSVAGKTGVVSITKADVGLGNVKNIEQASKEDLSPIKTKVDDMEISVNDHIASKSNPHGVTKEQVGLGNVKNEEQVTSSEFTPVKNRIDGMDDTLASHIGNKSNPHGVTKSQVGLGSVPNYAVATKTQAEEGTANNSFMTPLRTKQAINELTTNKLYISIIDVNSDIFEDSIEIDNIVIGNLLILSISFEMKGGVNISPGYPFMSFRGIDVKPTNTVAFNVMYGEVLVDAILNGGRLRAVSDGTARGRLVAMTAVAILN